MNSIAFVDDTGRVCVMNVKKKYVSLRDWKGRITLYY